MKIEYTNLDQIMFPESNLTKEGVIEYYNAVAPVMLLHTRNHPLVMQRFPRGIDHESFYQKEVPDYFPEWFSKKQIRLKQGGYRFFGVIQKKDDLLYLANQAVITPHLWLSTAEKPRYPDRLIFDLDPSREDLDLLHEVAVYVRKILEERNLQSYIMTTGSRGFHIVVPLVQNRTFTVVRNFAKQIAQEVVAAYPKHCTIEMSKEKRGHKMFIDYLRNGYGQTGVAPYALRALPGAPVATPIEWNELKKTDSQRYNIHTILQRIQKKGDAWKTMHKHPQELV
jgi:bifunctional non-homologous end joining protein LigD